MTNEAAMIWPPAAYIHRELKARGWTVQELAEAVNYGPSFFDNVLKCRKMTEWDARTLASAFDTSPELWLNLDKRWRDALESGEYVLVKEGQL